jgi:hypothetical protein
MKIVEWKNHLIWQLKNQCCTVYNHILLLNKFGLHAEEGDRFKNEFFVNGGSESVISALKILHVNIKRCGTARQIHTLSYAKPLASKRFY